MRKYTELEVAFELEKLVRIFETVAKNRPNLAGGLSAAVGYTKLWSQKFAPNENGHPYPDFDIKADQIAPLAEEGKIRLQVHVAPVETPRKIRIAPQMTEVEFEQTLHAGKPKRIFTVIMGKEGKITFGSVNRVLAGTDVTGSDIGSMFSRLCSAGIISRIGIGLYVKNNGEQNVAAE